MASLTQHESNYFLGKHSMTLTHSFLMTFGFMT